MRRLSNRAESYRRLDRRFYAPLISDAGLVDRNYGETVLIREVENQIRGSGFPDQRTVGIKKYEDPLATMHTSSHVDHLIRSKVAQLVCGDLARRCHRITDEACQLHCMEAHRHHSTVAWSRRQSHTLILHGGYRMSDRHAYPL